MYAVYLSALQCFPFLVFVFDAKPVSMSQSNNLQSNMWDVCHHQVWPGHHDSLAEVFNTEEIVLYERLTKVSPCDHNNRVPCWVYSCKHPVLTTTWAPGRWISSLYRETVRTVRPGRVSQYSTDIRGHHWSQLTPDCPAVRSAALQLEIETRRENISADFWEIFSDIDMTATRWWNISSVKIILILIKMNYNFYLIISSLVLLIPRTQGETSFIAKIFSDA